MGACHPGTSIGDGPALLMPLHAAFAIDALDECRDHRRHYVAPRVWEMMI
jgi:hypothetical protein